jgi:hypothetical protein
MIATTQFQQFPQAPNYPPYGRSPPHGPLDEVPAPAGVEEGSS